MKLTIVDNAALEIGTAFGIPLERANKISGRLDTIMNDILAEKGFSYAQLLSKIAEVCNTNEELVYAVLNNNNWLIKHGYYNPLTRS